PAWSALCGLRAVRCVPTRRSSELLAKALAKRGYETLTPVQQSMLDPALVERDALVSAQTGSGKTVAFGLAMAPTLLGESDRFDRDRKSTRLNSSHVQSSYAVFCWR